MCIPEHASPWARSSPTSVQAGLVLYVLNFQKDAMRAGLCNTKPPGMHRTRARPLAMHGACAEAWHQGGRCMAGPPGTYRA